MPAAEIHITLTVKAINQKGNVKQSDITFILPSNNILGVAIADPGKLKMGTAVEQLADMLDKDQSPL